jgi:hypothetical protein
MNLDDIKLYLPKYLSAESTRKLIQQISEFPNNLSQNLYSTKLHDENVIFQGDGLKDIFISNLPHEKIGKSSVIVLSNTCDIDLSNKRLFPSQMFYAPIFNLEKYSLGLIKNGIKTNDSIKQHINDIKNQKITQILYLPPGGNLNYDGIVFLDRINNCPNKLVSRNKLKEQRLFILSDFGLYFFLLKISIHLTRIQEKIDRNIGKIL